MVICGRCGTQSPEGFRFSPGCGPPRGAPRPSAWLRSRAADTAHEFALAADHARRAAHTKEAREIFDQLGSLMGYQLWQTRAQIQRDEGPTTQAFIAEVALELGDHYAARAAADLSEELGAPEDVVNYAICHRVRDRLSLTEDDPQEAERWARSALENALQTDFPDIQANARLELSHVLSRLGRIEEAVGEGQTALVLYEGKGYRLGVRKAQAWLEELKRAPG